jgi:hypothetical protein
MFGEMAMDEVRAVEKILEYKHVRCCQITECKDFHVGGSLNLARDRNIGGEEETWLLRRK